MPENMDDLGSEFVGFLKNLYNEHPSLKSKQLVLTGESFAGKYLTSIAKAILEHNKNSTDQIIIKNLILSNPLVDVETERMY